MRVGMLMTPYFSARSGASSVLTLQTRSSGCSAAICATTGAIMRQGPHQVAQKSTRTGLSAPKTMVPKFSLRTSTGSILISSSARVQAASFTGGTGRWLVCLLFFIIRGGPGFFCNRVTFPGGVPVLLSSAGPWRGGKGGPAGRPRSSAAGGCGIGRPGGFLPRSPPCRP